MKEKAGKVLTLEALADILKERIVAHELPPGSKLLEVSLAKDFNVSRQRLRDAFAILESRGLIERVRNQGAIVARLTPEQVKALYNVRGVLEGFAVGQATLNAPEGTWDDLLDRFGDRMERAIAQNDLNAYIEGVDDFRRRIIENVDNAILSEMLDSVYDRTRFLVRRLVLIPGRVMQGTQQQRGILEAMRDRDAARAESLKRENIQSALQWFMDYQSYLL